MTSLRTPPLTVAIDVLYREHANATEAATMDGGHHYDYRAQRWIDGHDHAHFASDGRLLFCGADRVTCGSPAFRAGLRVALTSQASV